MTTEVFQRGDTVPIWGETRNPAGELFDPSQGVTLIYLKNPSGVIKAENEAMSKHPTEPETGKYVYYYASQEDDESEWWHYCCKSVDGTGATAKKNTEYGAFKLT